MAFIKNGLYIADCRKKVGNRSGLTRYFSQSLSDNTHLHMQTAHFIDSGWIK